MPFNRKSGTNPIYRTKAHRDARAALLRNYKPGDPCCLCGHPMWPLSDGRTSNLHADHIPGTNEYRGLAHGTRCQTCGKRCNQSDGAKRGRARQDARETQLKWLQGEVAPRPWLVKDNHPCPMCGDTVTWASQRCCSRSCANALRRSRKPPVQAIKPVACEHCLSTFTPFRRGERFCSDRCRLLVIRERSRTKYRVRVGIPTDAPLAASGRPRSIA